MSQSQQFLSFPTDIYTSILLYFCLHTHLFCIQEPRYIECLSDLCTSNGTAIPGTQELICSAVLNDPKNSDLFFNTQDKVLALPA